MGRLSRDGTAARRLHTRLISAFSRTSVDRISHAQGASVRLRLESFRIRSTGSDLEIKESCTGEGAKADVHLTFHASSPEHVTGTGTIVATTVGRTMKSDIKTESKWLGATCPADVK